MLYKSENLHGGDIYKENIEVDFSVNINPFGTPKEVYDAMADSLKSIHNYPDPYCRELLRAISEYENIPEEYILLGNGAAELIYNYCRAINVKSAVHPVPTFSEYALGLKAAAGSDCDINRYLLEKDNGFLLDEGFLDYIKKLKPESVFLCNPNNPTGRLIPSDLMVKILSYCKDNNVRLFVDECFLELSDAADHKSDDYLGMKKYLSDYKGLFILKAFTKNYGMAGVRLGYCLSADKELLSKMSSLSQPWNISIPAQAAGVAAIKCRYFIEKARTIIPIERMWLSEKLTELGMAVIPSEANFIIFKGPENLDESLRKLQISIRDCSNFESLHKGWFRIAVKLHEDNVRLIEAIKRIEG